MALPTIYWLDSNKFDCCQHRIVRVSMVEALRRRGIDIRYITAYLREPIPYEGFHYLDTRTRIPGLYRLAFLSACLGFLWREMQRGERMLLIAFPQTFYIALVARILGHLRGCRVEIHLDIRTVPVMVRSGRLRSRVQYFGEYLLFWKAVLWLSRRFGETESYITERMRRRIGARGKPWCVWSSGVREEALARVRPDVSVVEGQPMELLYLGAIAPNRGVAELVRAFLDPAGAGPDWVLRILGGGSESAMIRSMIDAGNAGGRVQMEGQVPPESAPVWLANAHAFVTPLPDHPWWEVSSPIKLFEYLATGKPLLLTDTPFHRDVVPRDLPGVIWLADLSPKAFRRGLRHLRGNYSLLLESWGERVALAREYTWDVQAERLGVFLRSQYEGGEG